MTTVKVTISGTYGWTPGRGVLATLRPTNGDVGYLRQEVEGSVEDFDAAIRAARTARESASGSHRCALTRLIQRLESAVRA